MWIFYIHPLIQSSCLLSALYALFHGMKRLFTVLFGLKLGFNWKHHVTSGMIALAGWFLGIIAGIVVARMEWGGWFISGLHAKIGIFLFPMIFFGFASGLYMNLKPLKRKILPLVHGINNICIVVLSIVQVFIGTGVLREFVLGM